MAHKVLFVWRARCSALIGMDEAAKTTPLPVPEPSSTRAMGQTGHVQGLLTATEMEEVDGV